MTTPHPLMAYRHICYAAPDGTVFRSLTLSDEGWAAIDAALQVAEAASEVLTRDQVRAAARVELANYLVPYTDYPDDDYGVVQHALSNLCRRLGVEL